MISRRSLLLAFGATASFSAPAGAQKSWATFKNERFGATIDYPTDRFQPKRRPTDTDGRQFVARDGAEFTCSGIRNVLEESLADIETTAMKTLDQEAMIMHRDIGSNFFVLWGMQSSRVFYQHSILSHSNEILNTFAMSYPARRKSTYDPIVMRMSESFKPGVGTDSGPL